MPEDEQEIVPWIPEWHKLPEAERVKRLEELKEKMKEACSILGGTIEETPIIRGESRLESLDCPLKIKGEDVKIRWIWARQWGEWDDEMKRWIVPPEKLPKAEKPNEAAVIIETPAGMASLDGVEHIYSYPEKHVSFETRKLSIIGISPKGWHARL